MKIWWDCVKDDMESLGLSKKDAQFRNKWRCFIFCILHDCVPYVNMLLIQPHGCQNLINMI